MLTVVAESVCHALDKNGKVRTDVLDILKAFETIWHFGLLHNLC